MFALREFQRSGKFRENFHLGRSEVAAVGVLVRMKGTPEQGKTDANVVQSNVNVGNVNGI